MTYSVDVVSMAAGGLYGISDTISGVRKGVKPPLVWGRQRGVAIVIPSFAASVPTRTPRDVNFSRVKFILIL